MKIETVIDWDFAGNWVRNWCNDAAMQVFKPVRLASQGCKFAFRTPDNTIEHIELVKDQMAIVLYDMALTDTMSVRWESALHFFGMYFDFSDEPSLSADIPATSASGQYFIGYSSSFFKPTFTLQAAKRMKGISLIISETLLYQLLEEYDEETLQYQALFNWESFAGATAINKHMVHIYREATHKMSVSAGEPFSKIYLQGNAYRLFSVFLTQLLSEYNKDYANAPHEMRQLVWLDHQIMQHFLHQLPNMEQAAQMVNMSTSKFKRAFKAVFGDSYYHHYKDIKLEQAKALLVEGHLNIKEIATQLGYRSGDSFAKAFALKFGKQPSKVMR